MTSELKAQSGHAKAGWIELDGGVGGSVEKDRFVIGWLPHLPQVH